MKMAKTRHKLTSILLAFFLLCSFLSHTGTPVRAETTTARIVVENATFFGEKSPWSGTLVDKDIVVEYNMTIMDAIVDALQKEGKTQQGAIEGYIYDIEGLTEKNADAGDGSGWMIARNDWFINQSASSFYIESGDVIHVQYTCNYGKDLGCYTDNSDTSILAVDIQGETSISPEFNSGVFFYDVSVPKGQENVYIKAVASNKNYQLRAYNSNLQIIPERELRDTDAIPVRAGDEIHLICGDPEWPSLNKNAGAESEKSEYVFRISIDGNTNHVPTINTSVTDETITIGKTYSIELSNFFIDEDGDNLTYQYAINEEGYNSCDQVFEYTPSEIGDYNLFFVASDGTDLSEPLQITLHVVSGDGHKVNLSIEGGGNLSVDKIEATAGSTVIIKNNTNTVSKLALKKLIVKLQDESILIPELRDSAEYLFVMPDQDVSVEAEFGTLCTVSILGPKQYGGRSESVRVWNEDGLEISLTPPGNSPVKPWTLYVSEGKFSYKLYNREREFLSDNFEILSDDLTRNRPTKDIYYKEFNFSTNSYFYVGSSHKFGFNVSLYDANNNPVDPLDYTLADGGGYLTVRYLMKMNDTGSTSYSYSASMVDDYWEKVSGFEGSGQFAKTTARSAYNVLLNVQSAISSYEISIPKGANAKAYFQSAEYTSKTVVPWLTGPIQDSQNDDYEIFTIRQDYYGAQLYIVAGGEGTNFCKTVLKVPKSLTEGEESYRIDLVQNNSCPNEYYVDSSNDLYTSVGNGGYISCNVADTFTINAYRVDQTVETATSGTFFEPETSFEVIYGTDTIKVDRVGAEDRYYANVTALKEGIAVIRIKYDEILFGYASSVTSAFPAIDNENVGIVVINVGGNAETISPNLLIAEGQEYRYEYDTIYYASSITYPDGTSETKDSFAEYSFVPTSSVGIVKVSVHKPLYLDGDFESGWEEYEADENGEYTIKLYEGRNILKLEDEESVVYTQVCAKATDVIISNETSPNEKVISGDECSVSFSNLELPVYKMCAIYNPGYPKETWTEYINASNGLQIRSSGTQYEIFNVERNKIFFTPVENGDLSLIQGKIHCAHLGSALGSHHSIPEGGLYPNFNASYGTNNPYFGRLPDIAFYVAPAVTVSADPEEGGEVTVTKSETVNEDGNYTWTISAEPAEGYYFESWSDKASGKTLEDVQLVDGKYVAEVTPSEDTEYVATFKAYPKATADVNLEGAGTVTATEDEAKRADKTATWTMTAEENEGYVFLGWAKASDPETILADGAAEITEVLTEDTTYIAKFKVEGVPPVAEVSADPADAGTPVAVQKSYNRITEKAVWELTAPESEEYHFLGWFAGNAEEPASTDYVYTVTLDSNMSFTAKYSEKQIPQATVAASPEEAGSAAAEMTASSKVDETATWLLTATPNTGYEFVRWLDENGEEVSTEASVSVSLEKKDASYTAVFKERNSIVTVSVNDPLGGTAEAKQTGRQGINTAYTLTAKPNDGYYFDGWTKKGETTILSETASYYAEVSGDEEYVANFKPYPVATASVSEAKAGTAQIEKTGVNGKASIWKMTATVNKEYKFLGWFVDDGTETPLTEDTELTITITKDTAFIAKYAEKQVPTLTVSVDPENAGTVTVKNQKESKADEYLMARLTAKAADGYYFRGWSEEDDETIINESTTITVELTAMDGSYVARFAKFPVGTVSVNDEAGGTVTIKQTGDNAKTTKWKVTASVNEDYYFAGWSIDKDDDIVSTKKTETFEIDEDTEFVANFVKYAAATVTVSDEAAGSAEAVCTKKSGTTATWKLTASVNEGYQFLGWAYAEDPDEILSTKASYTTDPLEEDTAYIALFEKEAPEEPKEAPKAAVSADPAAGGTVTAEMTESDTDKGTATWKLTAEAKDGYTFNGWFIGEDTEKAVSEETVYTVTILTDTAYVARFEKEAEPTPTPTPTPTPGEDEPKETPKAAVAPSNEEAGSVSAELVSETDGSATWKLTATPKDGYKFVKWVLATNTAETVSTDAETEVTIEESTTYMAVFEKEDSGSGNEDGEDDTVTTLTYKNYPVSVSGKGLSKYQLVVTPLEADHADVKLMQQATPSDKKLIRLYDVKLYLDGEEVQPPNTITVAFEVGSEYEGQTLKVLHAVNGSIETHTGTVKDGKIAVAITHLSGFGVEVSTTSSGSGTNTNGSGTGSGSGSGSGTGTGGTSGGSAVVTSGVKTGDTTPIMLFVVLLAASAGVLVVLFAKRKKSLKS